MSPANQQVERLKTIKWNGTGGSGVNTSLALLLLILANHDYLWAKQILDIIVDQHIDFNWNQTSFDVEHMGNTTPLLYLTMMAESSEPWAEALLIKVIDHDIQRYVKNALILDQNITIH